MNQEVFQRYTKFWVAIVFALLFLSPSFANAIGHRPVKRFTTADGLPSSIIYTVFEDSKGYLWVGTDGGVSMYDGYTFKNFSPRHGLPANSILGIDEDSQGRIWFRSSRAGLSYYQNGKVHVIAGNEKLLQLLPALREVCTSIYIDKESTIWLSYTRSDFLIKIPATNNWSLPEKVMLPALNGSYCYVNQWFPDSDAWFGSFTRSQIVDSVLTVFSGKERRTKIDFKPGYHVLTSIRILIKKPEFVLFSINNTLVWLYSNGKILKREMPDLILSANEDDKSFYVGLQNIGCIKLSKADFEFCVPEYLFSGTVTGIEIDRSGNFWYSLYDGGLNCCAWLSAIIYNKEDGLGTDNVQELRFFRGGLYLGHPYHQFSTISNDVRVFPYMFTDIYESENGNWYLMGGVSGLAGGRNDSVFDGIKERFQFNSSYQKRFRSSRDKALVMNEHLRLSCKKINFWQGRLVLISNGEISFANLNTFVCEDTIVFPSIITSTMVTSNDEFWVGCNGGLFNVQNGSVVKLYGKKDAFSNPVSSLCRDNSYGYLMGTKGNGLYYCKDDSVIYHLDESSGLLSNTVNCIVACGDDKFWVGTSAGLHLISRDFKLLESITSDHGLPENEVNDVVQVGSTVYVATSGGVLRFDLKDLVREDVVPNLFIVGVQVNGVAMPADSRLLKNLDYQSDNIRIHFAGINLSGGKVLRYRYRFGNGEWSYTTSTSLDFPRLSIGEYAFELQVQVLNGKWSKPVHLYFMINPPWWKQNWFIVIEFAGILVVLIAVLLFVNNRRVKKESERIQFTRQLEQLRLQALQAQMNPHFMFNVMGSIQHFILNNDSVNASSYLTRFSRLIRNVLEQSSAERINLDQELETLRLYLQLESLRMEHFSYEIVIAGDVSTGSYLIPPMIIQPFIENAIWHGLMNKAGDRKILVRVYLSEQGQLIVEVEDNGIGRKAAALIKTKNNKLHNSKAMELIEKRIDALKYLYQQQITVQITDLYTDTGNAAGTKSQIIVSSL
jgi:hypothetical protein